MLDGDALDEGGFHAPPVVIAETLTSRAAPALAAIPLPLMAPSGGESTALADQAAARIRPADFFTPPPAPETISVDPPRRVAAASAALVLHAGLCLGLVHFAHQGMSGGDADLEIPIEVVVGGGPEAGVATDARQAAAEPQAAPTDARRETAPAEALQPVTDATASNLARDAREPEERPPAPSPVAPVLLTTPHTPDTTGALERHAQETVRRAARIETDRLARDHERAVERARQRARERAQDRAEEQERQKELAQRAAERADARREARAMLETSSRNGGGGDRRGPVGSDAAPRQTRLGDTDGFDAASYRALIARAVHAAVGSRCSEGAGSRVVIALVVGRSGAIASASVASASGNAAFDLASVAAVRRAGPFPPPTGRSSVSVPVGVACR